jgi:hypothetical protein
MMPLLGYLAQSANSADCLSQGSACCPVPLLGLTCANRLLQDPEIIVCYVPLRLNWRQTP